MKNLFNKAAFYLATRTSAALGCDMPRWAGNQFTDMLNGTPAALDAFLTATPDAVRWTLWDDTQLLGMAGLYHKPEHIKVLLKHRAEIDHQDKRGMSALMWAAHEERVLTLAPAPAKKLDAAQLDAVLTLLEAGANPLLKDKSGKTASQLSRTREIRELLAVAEGARKPASGAPKP